MAACPAERARAAAAGAHPGHAAGPAPGARAPAGRRPGCSGCSGAVEQVGQRLEADWSQRFTDRLCGPGRARAGRRGGARPPLAAHLDPLPRRDAAAGPERPGDSGAGAPARAHLQRRVRPELGGERRDRARPRRRPAGGPRSDAVLGRRHSASRCATSCCRSPRRRALAVRLSPPESDFRVGHPVALSRVLLNLTTNALKFTGEGYVEVAARQVSATRWSSRCGTPGAGIPPQSHDDAVRAVPPAPEAGRVRLLRLGPGPLDLPQAGRGDGVHPAGRDRPRLRDALLLVLELPLAGEGMIG